MARKIKFGRFVKPLLVLGDFIAVNIAFYITVWTVCFPHWQHPKWVLMVLNVAFAISEFLFRKAHNNRIPYLDSTILFSVKTTAMSMLIFATLLYAIDIFDVSLFQGCMLALWVFLLVTIWRVICQRVLKKIRRMGLNYRRVIIVGAGNRALALYHELQKDAGLGYRIMGFFDDNEPKLDSMPGAFHGSFSDIEPFVRTNNIDLIYYTLDVRNHDQISSVMTLADELGVEFIYVPQFNIMLADQFTPEKLGSMPLMLHTFSPLTKVLNRILKRLLDLSIAVPFVIISPIIFIPIAIAVKCSSRGPIFFKQKRTGIHGKDFMCYKFRTMRVNADADKVQATENDPRKTAVGDFLRRSSLDELPQFYNVLFGNMSVVGPRPHMVSHTKEYMQLIDKYMIRHAVKPGITGWAQVNGYRGGTKHLWQMEKRVQYDVWYITNWNIFLDIKIIFMTALNGSRGDKNAY